MAAHLSFLSSPLSAVNSDVETEQQRKRMRFSQEKYA